MEDHDIFSRIFFSSLRSQLIVRYTLFLQCTLHEGNFFHPTQNYLVPFLLLILFLRGRTYLKAPHRADSAGRLNPFC